MDEEPEGLSYETFSKMLGESIPEANQNTTHADFVAGVQSRTMGFKCIEGKPHQLIRGARRTVFTVLVLLYLAIPPVLVPLWAWHEHNWWLLLGIIVSGIGTWIAARLVCSSKRQTSIGAFFLVAFLTSSIFLGLHSYLTFFLLSAWWGLMLFIVADNAEKEYAMQSLVENRDLFDQAIAQNKIMIVRKDDVA